ncbi:ankyrin repeat domain-containing protein [Superficieibacter sp. 1612_C1]|uniref:ankyrin repeat domain-containing protein n=1 Tax=Superficieibacter sp. 1612_C1 TaxID=2780382 RepID=UPI0018835F38|nr:ankyrin repeat domain-containing protein [Superficieibacter sp. 1612_C1]
MKTLSAADILKRYHEEGLPEFSGIDLIFVNQSGIFGNTPMHIACVRGDIDEVMALINGGANINAIGEHGNTPLHEAVGQGNNEIIKILVTLGCRVKVKNDFGDTPLDIAKINDRSDIIELLKLHKIV